MATLRAARAWTRRQFLVRSTSSLALAGLGPLATPNLSRAADRPLIAGGIQSGDVSDGSAVIWARADRPARMQVECASVESFRTILCMASTDARPDADLTAKVLLHGLPPGQDIFYRARFDDIATGIAGETRIGHFRTAPAAGQSISFVWSGDTAGQGWGIDISRGGYRSYRTMLENRPDFFIHSGDHIYADCTIPSELKLPNGEVWRNLVTEEKSEVARTLEQFCGNYKYNHVDENFSAFHASCRCSRNGTITRSPTTGRPQAASMKQVTMPTAPRAWSHARGGRFSISCRSARLLRAKGASTGGSPTDRCSTSS
jgi:alkaline phosphatase D